MVSSSGRKVAGSSVIFAGLLIYFAACKHYSHKSPNILVAVDKYGIPIDEVTPPASTSKTDILMLRTVKELESKVDSLSKQMNKLALHKMVVNHPGNGLKDKVEALSKSMLDTIKAVQHLSNQVSQLQTHQKTAESDSSENMIAQNSFPSGDQSTVIGSKENTEQNAASQDLESSNSHDLAKVQMTTEVAAQASDNAVLQSSDPLSSLISRLQADINVAKAILISKSEHVMSAQERESLRAIGDEFARLLETTIDDNSTPADSVEQQRSQSTAGAAVIFAASPDLHSINSNLKKLDAHSSVGRLFSSSEPQRMQLKARTEAMEEEVAVLAERERKLLNALPSIHDEINRNQAVLSDGLQSLEIAQDRLVLASKAAEDSDDLSVEATKRLAEEREAQIQDKVKAELHQLAQAKQLAAEGPQLARILHQRRTVLRHLESQLQRENLLRKALRMESNKDFAG